MKTRNENLKRLRNVVDSFDKNDDTILALFTTDGQNGCSYVGEPSDVAAGFYALMKDGFAPKADKAIRDVVYGIVFAIEKVLEKGDATATHLGLVLRYAISNAQDKLIDNEEDDEEDEDEVEEEVDDDDEEDDSPICNDCLDCEDLKKCLNEKLADLGLMVVKKPTKKEKKSDDDE